MKRSFIAVLAAAAAWSALAGAQAPAAAPPGAQAAGAAQAASQKPGTAAPNSRWQGDVDRLDAQLRLRLLVANGPTADWVAGELDSTDIESRVKHFAAARVAAPDRPLYLASLATACLQPVRPQVAECASVDRLADWATRDTDNGVPMVLLADHAIRRGESDSAVAFIAQAAAATRFDDYWGDGVLEWWRYLRQLTIDVDPAAKAKAAAAYALERSLDWAPPLRTLCVVAKDRSEPMRAACASLGTAMAQRAASFALRRAGARVAEINAPDASARAAAQALQARILETTARCTQAEPDFDNGLDSPLGPARGRAIEQFDSWANAQGRYGEVGACEHLLAAAFPAKR